MAEFAVKCEECDNILDAGFYALGRDTILSVGPCNNCLSIARDEGYEESDKEDL